MKDALTIGNSVFRKGQIITGSNDKDPDYQTINCCNAIHKDIIARTLEQQRKEILEEIEKEIDEWEFTNLLREHKCVHVNSVMDDLKFELKSKLQIPTEEKK
jgi:hypothetical protein